MRDTSKLSAAGVARACSRVLKAANWPIYKRGRRQYELGTPGIHCWRIGYGSTVSVGWLSANPYEIYSEAVQAEKQQRERWAWEVLRKAGYQVDELGHIECGRE